MTSKQFVEYIVSKNELINSLQEGKAAIEDYNIEKRSRVITPLERKLSASVLLFLNTIENGNNRNL
jgi:hypothetical protein